MMEELRDAISESWESFWALGHFVQRSIIGATLAVVVVTVLAWKIMIPLILFAIGTTLYLRRSRDKDAYF